jgi:magnesium-transporting ATPase (P-type)
MDYLNLGANEVLKNLNTDGQKGLSLKDVKRRQQKYGKNIVIKEKKVSVFFKFLSQFKDLFAVILIIAALLSFFAGAKIDALVIFGIVFLNSAIGFFQEYKAERAMHALKKILPSFSHVIRGGKEKRILSSELVPGDIIILEEGDSVPADARVIEEYELETNDATLTGESTSKQKTSKSFNKKFSVIDAPNLVLTGTNITFGRGKAVVLTTGHQTEFGKIANLTQSITTEYSPLQIELTKLAKVVTKIVIVIGVIGILIGWWSGQPLVELFLFTLGVMVACVPEGLPATVSVALAAGVQRMAKRKALLKRLSAVETLGCTTVICTDKTGTLTKGEITVKEVWFPGKEIIQVSGSGYEPDGDFLLAGKIIDVARENELFFHSIALCNNAKLVEPSSSKKKWGVIGDPTEASLLTLLSKAGYNQQHLLNTNKRIYELSFGSVRKRMTSVHKDENGNIQAYVKGAPESTLDCCDYILINGKTEILTEERKKEILRKNDAFANKAYRVLAVAYRDLPDDKSIYTVENTEKNLIFLGLCALIDPPREEVAEAVKITKKAGIKIFMITGDYGLTARAIAKQIGIATDKTRIVEGLEIDNLNDDELKRILEQEIIFARVSPEHKMKIVKLLKDNGEVVAVTGDGVNDAPALKAADIGVAMGINGTDVSRESADMILLDDSFATITAAIEEGRRIFDNIKKFNLYVFSSNVGELFSIIYGVILSIPLPIIAIQILSIDLGTDVLPSLALGLEKSEEGIMEKPPRSRNKGLLSRKVLLHLLKIGVIMSSGAIIGFIIILLNGGWRFGQVLSTASPLYFKATTITYATLVIVQFVNAICARSERVSVFKLGIFSNKFLLGGIFISFLLLLSTIYIPLFNKVWHTSPIDGFGWIIIGTVCAVLFFTEEIRKFRLRKAFTKEIELTQAV